MGGTRSITQQLNYAINQNRRIGESKMGYKAAHNGKTGAQIFSNKYSKNLHDTAKSLGKFMKAMYPDVRMANQITSQHVQSYIDKMSPNWSQRTIENKISQIQKIGECIITTYSTRDNLYGIKSDLYGINPDVTLDEKNYTVLIRIYTVLIILHHLLILSDRQRLVVNLFGMLPWKKQTSNCCVVICHRIVTLEHALRYHRAVVYG